MGKDLIQSIYLVLLLYEDVLDSNNNVELKDYLAYLKRQSVRFLGINQEVSETLQGLYILGNDIDHKTVKSIVFHLMNILKTEGVK